MPVACETHGLTGNIAYSCDDTFSLVSLVSAGHRVCAGMDEGYAKTATSRFTPMRGVDLKIGLGVVWRGWASYGRSQLW